VVAVDMTLPRQMLSFPVGSRVRMHDNRPQRLNARAVLDFGIKWMRGRDLNECDHGIDYRGCSKYVILSDYSVVDDKRSCFESTHRPTAGDQMIKGFI